MNIHVTESKRKKTHHKQDINCLACLNDGTLLEIYIIYKLQGNENHNSYCDKDKTYWYWKYHSEVDIYGAIILFIICLHSLFLPSEFCSFELESAIIN